MHRFRAVADERGEMVDIDRVSGFGHQPDPRAETDVHQMLPHGADREQHRDRGVTLVGRPVADDDDARAPPGRPLGRAAERGERGPEAVGSLRYVPDRIEGHGGEPGDVPECGHLVVQQDRVLQPQHAGVARPLQQR
jgi:hypothetical protein